MFAVAWGLIKEAGGPYTLSEALLRKLKSLGYAGIEVSVASIMDFDNKAGVSGAFKAALIATNTRCIAGVFSSGSPPIPGNLGITSLRGINHIGDADLKGTRDAAGHFTIWSAQVREALAMGGGVIAGINSHSGKDYFSESEADEFFTAAIALEASEAAPLGIKITHETHRARQLYSPWTASRIIKAHPALRYTADLSHWSVVTETSYLDPEVNAVVDLIAPNVRHVHARIGFEEGPQIPDPRGPEWAHYLTGYEGWWTLIYTHMKNRGDKIITTTPEFGPKAYAWSHPYSGETLNNIWAINHFVGQRMSALFTKVFGEGSATLIADPEEGVWPDIK